MVWVVNGSETSGPPLLASGRGADVYELDEGRVLRRYRDGSRPPAAEVEAMRFAARHGYPVPRVHAVDGPDMILDFVDGPTMLSAAQTGRLDVEVAACTLAELHARLHALPAPPGRPAGELTLHLDLHPNNVIMSPGGPVVIDWRNAGHGPAELDVALSAVILAHVAVDRDDPLSELARAFLDPFLRAVDVDPVRLLDRALARRAADFPGDAERTKLLRAAALVVAAG
jgi:aminoglycoside phosphotransferase (APT) family kinase protein